MQAIETAARSNACVLASAVEPARDWGGMRKRGKRTSITDIPMSKSNAAATTRIDLIRTRFQTVLAFDAGAHESASSLAPGGRKSPSASPAKQGTTPPTANPSAKTDAFAQKRMKCVPLPTMAAKRHAYPNKIPGRDNSSTAFNVAFRNRLRTSCIFMRRLNTPHA